MKCRVRYVFALCSVCFAVSERIMKFVQSDTHVSELELVRQCRDQRASLRAEGLRLTRALVTAAASPPAKVWYIACSPDHY